MSDLRDKYINIIKTQKGKIEDHKMFEYMAAVKLDMIMWEDISEKDIAKLKLPHRADYGIDLVSRDFRKTAQVKYYGKNSTITWRSISTFTSYSMIFLHTSDMILVTTKDAKIPDIVARSIPKILRYDMSELEPTEKEEGYLTWVMGKLKWW